LLCVKRVMFAEAGEDRISKIAIVAKHLLLIGHLLL
jgi:hypothetical protein